MTLTVQNQKSIKKTLCSTSVTDFITLLALWLQTTVYSVCIHVWPLNTLFISYTHKTCLFIFFMFLFHFANIQQVFQYYFRKPSDSLVLLLGLKRIEFEKKIIYFVWEVEFCGFGISDTVLLVYQYHQRKCDIGLDV